MSQIWIDADAVPKEDQRKFLESSMERKVKMTFVANRWMETPRYPTISVEVVPAGLDKADDRIAEAVQKGDLVITADIPLAARCVESGGYIITPRGRVLIVTIFSLRCNRGILTKNYEMLESKQEVPNP